MSHQEMIVAVARELGVVRHRDRCRVHHHQPEGQQRDRHPQQRLIEALHTRGGGRTAVAGSAHRNGRIGAGRAGEPADQALAPRAHWVTSALRAAVL